MIYNMVIGALMAFLISMVFIAMIDSVGLRFLIYMMIYVLVELIIIAFSYKMTSSAMIDLTLNQSVEFLRVGYVTISLKIQSETFNISLLYYEEKINNI